MAKILRIEVIDYPYHVIQRGNRNQRVFLKESDKEKYLRILKTHAEVFGIEVWAYCLMDNHVHLIVVPKQKGALTESISQVHRLYSRMINLREGWSGHLWQSRFLSYPMDEQYLWAAVRYVERNPVRAGMVDRAEDYSWSSAKTHVKKIPDNIVTPFYLMDEIKDWSLYLSEPDRQENTKDFKLHAINGRPLGNRNFVEDLEKMEGRPLSKKKAGRKMITKSEALGNDQQYFN